MTNHNILRLNFIHMSVICLVVRLTTHMPSQYRPMPAPRDERIIHPEPKYFTSDPFWDCKISYILSFNNTNDLINKYVYTKYILYFIQTHPINIYTPGKFRMNGLATNDQDVLLIFERVHNFFISSLNP